jgi:hypothetical protein
MKKKKKKSRLHRGKKILVTPVRPRMALFKQIKLSAYFLRRGGGGGWVSSDQIKSGDK